MEPLAIGVAVFVCTLGGALLGMWLRGVLPPHHLQDDSRDTMKLGIGLVATLTALVLGLVTASTKSAFDELNTTIRHAAVDALELDRTLARYGPETAEIRMAFKQSLAGRIETVWSREAPLAAKVDTSKTAARVEGLSEQIRALTPQTELQKALQARAIDQTEALLKTRWATLGGLESAVPWPFVTILVFWLTITFASFGLQAPRNGTVLAVLVVCALSVAGAVFLVLEMDSPFEGLIQVSSAPLRYAVSRLGL
jgi:hypothetical protein